MTDTAESDDLHGPMASSRPLSSTLPSTLQCYPSRIPASSLLQKKPFITVTFCASKLSERAGGATKSRELSYLRKALFFSNRDSKKFRFQATMALCGGKRPVDLANSNDLEIDELAKFAVSEHNNQQNSLKNLTFSKVVSAHTQVVQGTMYHLVIEVEEESKPKHYEAQVWVKSWENFKKLQEFKPKDVAA